MDDMVWVIWSREHNGWWRANRNGYTNLLKEAGHYTLEEATDICIESNKYLAEEEFREHGPEESLICLSESLLNRISS